MKIKKKVILFFKLLPFVNLGLENFNKDTCISKHFIVSSFKFCQLITSEIIFILVQIRSADRG